jgi:formylglycine-generating enzyme
METGEMEKASVLTILVCLLATANVASADTIRGINMEFVTIGNAGNVGDTRTELDEHNNPIADPYNCGAVAYTYRIGKYEITNTQWNAFTAAAGAPTGIGRGYFAGTFFAGEQQPITNTSWLEAAQFCNYLTSGDKSKGAYQFSGDNVNPGNFIGTDRITAQATYGKIFAIPTQDEWYKAAYYKPDGSGYSMYANGTDTLPIDGIDANFDSLIGHPWDVGSGTIEQNGTWDMMGNVWEWNENRIGPFYPYRGGAYTHGFQVHGIASSHRYAQYIYAEGVSGGFRIVSIVPEPASAMLMMLGAVWMAAKRRRQISVG